MPDFRLRQDTEDFFRYVKDTAPLQTKWDLYYLCAIVGLLGRRTSDPAEEDISAPVFVQQVIEGYKPIELILVALLLMAQMSRVGYRAEDKKEIQRLLGQLVDPRAQALGSEGAGILNRYASGGYDLLIERYGDVPPRAVEDFLPRYTDILSELIGEMGAPVG